MKKSLLFLAFALFLGFSVQAQSQRLSASADVQGSQDHAIFTGRPANFFIYDQVVNNNAQIEYNLNQLHDLTGTRKIYNYALAPNLSPVNEGQLVAQYASIISAQGGTIYENSASGGKMELIRNGVNYFVMVTPSGGGTQYSVTVFEYDPALQH